MASEPFRAEIGVVFPDTITTEEQAREYVATLLGPAFERWYWVENYYGEKCTPTQGDLPDFA